MKTVLKLGLSAVAIGAVCWTIPPLRQRIYRGYQGFSADFQRYEQSLREALMPETVAGDQPINR